jgi:hypothetical protein
MSRIPTPAGALILAAAFVFPAASTWPAEAGGDAHVAPSKTEAIPGTSLKRLILTDKATQRLDIRTDQIGQDPSGRKVAPYPALVYDLAGEAWVYTNPAPNTFVRHKIVVEQVKGAYAYLVEGPPEGTKVVTVGVAELYGTERGVGH